MSGSPFLLPQRVDAALVIGTLTAVDERQAVSAERLRDRVLGAQMVLARAGLQPGDRVVTVLPNSVDALVTDLALLRGGFVRTALTPRLHDREITQMIRGTGARVVVTSEEHGRWAGCGADVLGVAAMTSGATGCPTDPVPAEVGPDDAAALLATSGTSGTPKAAIASQGSFCAMVDAWWSVLHAGPDETILHCMPMSHLAGSVGIAVALRGARVVIQERFSARAVLEAIARESVTVVTLVPILLERIVEEIENASSETYDLSSLRAVVYGAAPARESLLRRARTVLPPDVLLQVYGLSEALAPITALLPHHHRTDELLSTIGFPVPPNIVSIESSGEIVVEGPAVSRGYWRQPPTAVRRWNTGDLGELTSQGAVRLLGRLSDVIITGGFNVHPAEVESAIRQVNGVHDVRVFGMPDARWGESVRAVVLPVRGARVTPETIDQVCRRELAAYKKPVEIRVIDRFPQTPQGKIDVAALRELMQRRGIPGSG